jgi:hypothetical protein
LPDNRKKKPVLKKHRPWDHRMGAKNISRQCLPPKLEPGATGIEVKRINPEEKYKFKSIGQEKSPTSDFVSWG